MEKLLQSTQMFELSQEQGSWWPISVLGPRQKSDDFPTTFLQLFIDFWVDFPLLYNISKIWSTVFPFRQIIANFQFHHGQK